MESNKSKYPDIQSIYCTFHGRSSQIEGRYAEGGAELFCPRTEAETQKCNAQMIVTSVHMARTPLSVLSTLLSRSYKTRPSRPIRCDMWIVERMRYPTDQQTDQPTDTAIYRGVLSHLKTSTLVVFGLLLHTTG